MRKRMGIGALVVGGALIGGAAIAVAQGGPLDFGLFRDGQLSAHSNQLFGVVKPA